MANYKVVDAERLDADLASVADSIRAKAGTADQMAFPDGFKSAVEGIQTGGAVELPDAEDATFGTGSGSDITEYKVQRSTMDGLADEARRIIGSENEMSTTEMLDVFTAAKPIDSDGIPIETGKSYFNGRLLPDIPTDYFLGYPYLMMVQLIGATSPSVFGSTSKPYYWVSSGTERLELPSGRWESVLSGNEWAEPTKASDSYLGINKYWTLVWSNFDIPKGSSTATAVYFEGTKSIPQTVAVLKTDDSIKRYATESEMLADAPGQDVIGIVTSVPINGVIFSTTEPANPVDDMLWIQTGYDTNPVRINSIDVCPIYAKQLISGKWTAVAAMTYTDGTWKSWKVPLYTKGDEHRPWTGGWALKDLSYSGTVFKAPTITRYADYVELKQNTITQGGVYHCVKPVDLTGRKTLYFDGILKSSNTTLPHWVGIFLWTSLGEHVEDNFVTEFNSPVSGAVSFDVEQFDGEYCIGIFVYQNGSSATLREMYVE